MRGYIAKTKSIIINIITSFIIVLDVRSTPLIAATTVPNAMSGHSSASQRWRFAVTFLTSFLLHVVAILLLTWNTMYRVVNENEFFIFAYWFAPYGLSDLIADLKLLPSVLYSYISHIVYRWELPEYTVIVFYWGIAMYVFYLLVRALLLDDTSIAMATKNEDDD